MRSNLFIKLLHEPLVHFFAVAGILYLFQMDSVSSQPLFSISVECDKNLSKQQYNWQKEWGKEPGELELSLLKKQNYQHELLFTAALESGLVKEDKMIYQYLIQKEKEILKDIPLKISDVNVLKEYYNRHLDDYREDGIFSFCQVFVSPSHKNPVQKARELLDILPYAGDILCDALQVGDYVDQRYFENMPAKEIEKLFGKSFYKQFRLFKVGLWQGPLISSKGIHLVLLQKHKAGKLLPFEKVKKLVESDYRQMAGRKHFLRQMQILQEKYPCIKSQI